MKLKEVKVFKKWKQKALDLQVQTFALYFALRDPRVPWYAKGFIGLIVAYAFSPVDLIPDFIPLLGYLDDLLIIPLGVSLALKMIPPEAMEESRVKAEQHLADPKPESKIMGAVILLIWLVILFFVIRAAVRAFLK